MSAAATLAWDLARTALAAGRGPLELRVRGDCMAPLLADGDVVTLERVDLDRLRPGALVVAAIDGNVVCHRLLRGRGRLSLAADGNLTAETASSADLVGVVIAVRRPGGVSRRLPRHRRLAARLLAALHPAHRGRLSRPLGWLQRRLRGALGAGETG